MGHMKKQDQLSNGQHLDFTIDKENVRSQLISNTFNRTWINVNTPPKEGGRYWCLIEEQTDLGKSHFQWNCNYHETEKRWSDNHKNYNVIYWTELAPMPNINI